MVSMESGELRALNMSKLWIIIRHPELGSKWFCICMEGKQKKRKQVNTASFNLASEDNILASLLKLTFQQ